MLCIFTCFITSQILAVLTTFVLFFPLFVIKLPYYRFFHIIIFCAHIFVLDYIFRFYNSLSSFFSFSLLRHYIRAFLLHIIAHYFFHLSSNSIVSILFRLMRMDPHFSCWRPMLDSCITSVFVDSFRILWYFFFLFIYRSLYSLKRRDSTKRNKNEHREGTRVVLTQMYSKFSRLWGIRLLVSEVRIL